MKKENRVNFLSINDQKGLQVHKPYNTRLYVYELSLVGNVSV